MGVTIDLNADLGEGFGIWQLGDDEALLDVVTSANVACGFHGGDPVTMRRVCARAVDRGVAIGAQVGYRDLIGFGRRRIDIDPSELEADVVFQLGALEAFARVAGDRVRYVKPHGALYNTVVHDTAQAAAVIAAVRAVDPSLAVLALPGSELLRLAELAGLRAVSEAFADRGCTAADGTLVPRSEVGAVLHDQAMVVDRCVELARRGTVTTAEGTTVRVQAASVCVHGDTPGAVEIARGVRHALEAAGVSVAAFAFG